MERPLRLEAARRVDWRFVLPAPRLDRVACVMPADQRLVTALEELAGSVALGPLDELHRADQEWDVVVLDARVPEHRAASNLRSALELAGSDGWLYVELPPRARLRGAIRRTTRALRAAGAKEIRAHLHLPTLERATRIVPLDDRRTLATLLRRRGGRWPRRLRAIAMAALVRFLPLDLFTGDVSLVARLRPLPEAMPWPAVDGLIPPFDATDTPESRSWTLLTPRFHASSHVILLMAAVDGAPRLVAKIARLPEDGSDVEREARMLESLASADVDASSVPRLVALNRVAGHRVLIEAALGGLPLDRATLRADPGRWIGSVRDWLTQMPVQRDAAPQAMSDLLGEAMDRCTSVLSPADGSGSELIARTRTALGVLAGRPLPRILEHGDLGHPNLLVQPGDRIAVLDWELGRVDGVPLHDLTFFLGYVALAVGGERLDPSLAFERVLEHSPWRAADALRAEADRLGIDRGLLPTLVLACWARSLAGHVGRTTGGSPTADRRQLERNRYYQLWEGTLRRHDRIAALLS